MFSDIKVTNNDKAGLRAHTAVIHRLAGVGVAEANNTKPFRVKEQNISSEV